MYRIKELRKTAGLTQKDLADKIGVTQQAVQRYENNESEPKVTIALDMADFFGVSVPYLLGLDDDPGFRKALPKKSVEVPVVGKIAAGRPQYAFEDRRGTKAVSEDLAEAHPEIFWLVVSGNSMNKVFSEGTYVLIDPTREPQNHDIVAVMVGDSDATIKRIFFEGEDGKQIRLHPESYDPEYTDMRFSASEIGTPQLKIIGTAIDYGAPTGWRN